MTGPHVARRPWSAPVLAVAVLVLLLAGSGAALAGWQSSTTGTGTGRAGTLVAPTNVTAATPTCNGTTGAVRFSWTAPSGAVSYQLEVASNAAFTTGLQSGTTTNTSATASQAGAATPRTLYFRLRAVAGNWISANSSTASATIGPCLL